MYLRREERGGQAREMERRSVAARPVLGWVPEEKYWLFRMNQAREGAPMSIGTGLLEPHLWVPKSQGTARSSSTGLHVTFPSFCSPV